MNVSLPHCLKMLNVRFPHFLLSALNEAASLWAKKLKKCFIKTPEIFGCLEIISYLCSVIKSNGRGWRKHRIQEAKT